MNEKKYSEDELTAILGEAATRSANADTMYSLADIQRIAREADIAPDLAAHVAASLPVRATSSSSLLGESA